MPGSLPRLSAAFAIVTREGFPSLPFQQWWQQAVERIESSIADISSVVSALAGKQGADTTLTALAGMSATPGLIEQTGVDAFTKRALGVGAGTSVPTRADADARYDATGTAAAAVAAHEAAPDPHPQYLTAAEGDTLFLTPVEGNAAYVRLHQTATWAYPTGTVARTTFAAYAGQTVSNPPTQAEVQAIDDHVKALSQRVAALVTDLRGNGTLT